MKTSGDLGTKASENQLKKTSAGKKQTMGEALGTTPNMSKAVGHLHTMHKGNC